MAESLLVERERPYLLAGSLEEEEWVEALQRDKTLYFHGTL